MTSTRLMLILVSGTGLLATAGAAAQIRPTPVGPFDGTWHGESAKCFPSSSNYHFASIVVAGGSFSWAVAHEGRTQTCKITIDRDGSFASGRDCPFRLSGRFQGSKLAVQLKTSERECEIAARRP
jgi:hypothetical protein